MRRGPRGECGRETHHLPLSLAPQCLHGRLFPAPTRYWRWSTSPWHLRCCCCCCPASPRELRERRVRCHRIDRCRRRRRARADRARLLLRELRVGPPAPALRRAHARLPAGERGLRGDAQRGALGALPRARHGGAAHALGGGGDFPRRRRGHHPDEAQDAPRGRRQAERRGAAEARGARGARGRVCGARHRLEWRRRRRGRAGAGGAGGAGGR